MEENNQDTSQEKETGWAGIALLRYQDLFESFSN